VVVLPPTLPFRYYVDYVKNTKSAEEGIVACVVSCTHPLSESVFWKDYLKGFDTPTPLPYALPPVPEKDPSFADHEIFLAPADTKKIKRMCDFFT
jgi:hypothetical protein